MATTSVIVPSALAGVLIKCSFRKRYLISTFVLAPCLVAILVSVSSRAITCLFCSFCEHPYIRNLSSMSFLDSCKEYFGSDDLYEVLSLDRSAKDEDIKRAYRKLSLKVHPDRVADCDKTVATEKFKILSKIHVTLSDKEKRACYDDTGCVDEDGNGMDRDWSEYWRLLFKKITEEDIKNYEANYRGGDEERGDLISAYKKAKGDLDTILEYVPFSHPDDIPRFQDILRPLIQKGELLSYPKFFNDTPRKQAARKRKFESEEKRAKKFFEKENRKKKCSSQNEMDIEESALKAITERKKQREVETEAFFKHLEAKYGNSSSKKSKSKSK